MKELQTNADKYQKRHETEKNSADKIEKKITRIGKQDKRKQKRNRNSILKRKTIRFPVENTEETKIQESRKDEYGVRKRRYRKKTRSKI